MKKTTAISCAFLDIGGVLLTDGWDHLARKRAAANFKLGEGKESRSLEAMMRYKQLNKLKLIWCREGGSNPHDPKVGGF